jgi:hypothetical protein
MIEENRLVWLLPSCPCPHLFIQRVEFHTQTNLLKSIFKGHWVFKRDSHVRLGCNSCNTTVSIVLWSPFPTTCLSPKVVGNQNGLRTLLLQPILFLYLIINFAACWSFSTFKTYATHGYVIVNILFLLFLIGDTLFFNNINHLFKIHLSIFCQNRSFFCFTGPNFNYIFIEWPYQFHIIL